MGSTDERRRLYGAGIAPFASISAGACQRQRRTGRIDDAGQAAAFRTGGPTTGRDIAGRSPAPRASDRRPPQYASELAEFGRAGAGAVGAGAGRGPRGDAYSTGSRVE